MPLFFSQHGSYDDIVWIIPPNFTYKPNGFGCCNEKKPGEISMVKLFNTKILQNCYSQMVAMK